MRPPSDFLPRAMTNHLPSNFGLFILGGLSLALSIPMRAHSDALINPVAPLGILSLQFACNADSANAMLASWDVVAQQHARLSLYWDMGFALAYALALAALTLRIVNGRPLGSAAAVIAWLPIWAGAADWLENLLHLSLIASEPGLLHGLIPTLACSFALFKWSLLSAWLPGLIWLALTRKQR